MDRLFILTNPLFWAFSLSIMVSEFFIECIIRFKAFKRNRYFLKNAFGYGWGMTTNEELQDILNYPLTEKIFLRDLDRGIRLKALKLLRKRELI